MHVQLNPQRKLLEYSNEQKNTVGYVYVLCLESERYTFKRESVRNSLNEYLMQKECCGNFARTTEEYAEDIVIDATCLHSKCHFDGWWLSTHSSAANIHHFQKHSLLHLLSQFDGKSIDFCRSARRKNCENYYKKSIEMEDGCCRVSMFSLLWKYAKSSHWRKALPSTSHIYWIQREKVSIGTCSWNVPAKKKSSRTMRGESGNSEHLVLGCEFRHCRRGTNWVCW